MSLLLAENITMAMMCGFVYATSSPVHNVCNVCFGLDNLIRIQRYICQHDLCKTCNPNQKNIDSIFVIFLFFVNYNLNK